MKQSSTIEIYSVTASEITVVIDGVEVLTDQLFATVFGDSVITAVEEVNIDEFDIKKINVTDCPVHNRECSGCCETYDTSDDFDIEVGLWEPTVTNDPATVCLKTYWDGIGPAIWLYFFIDGDKDDESPTNRQCRMRVFISADEGQWDNYNSDNYDFGGIVGAYYEGAAFSDSDCDGRYPETLNLIDYNGTPPGEIGGFSWPSTLIVSKS